MALGGCFLWLSRISTLEALYGPDEAKAGRKGAGDREVIACPKASKPVHTTLARGNERASACPGPPGFGSLPLFALIPMCLVKRG